MTPRLPTLVLATALLLPAGLLAQTQHPDQGETTDPSPANVALAKKVLSTTPLIDGHNDLPWQIRESDAAPFDVEAYGLEGRTEGHTDIPRLREGMVGAQFWSVYVPCGAHEAGAAARVQLEEIDIARRIFGAHPGTFEQAYSASDVERIFAGGKVASFLGMEGGHAIENSLGALRAYHDLGARYMTLTHGCTLDWIDSATDTARHDGITRFGEEVVAEMNRLGMLVDLSHVSPASMSDVLDVAAAPVIFSHSSARALTDHPRNVPDSILRRLPENGGVVMVTFVPPFISEELRRYSEEVGDLRDRLMDEYDGDRERVRAGLRAYREENPAPRATLGDVADHIEHVREVAGIDHVGIGSDFDGISSTPIGLEDVSDFPALFAELARRGWTEGELRKLAGGNLLRVMREAEATARRLRRTTDPSTATIEELDGGGGMEG